MTIREQKQILFYFEIFLEKIQDFPLEMRNEDVVRLFTKNDLITCINQAYKGQYSQETLLRYSYEQCLAIIDNQHDLFSFLIEKWKSKAVQIPTFNQEEVSEFFKRTCNEIHYLASKSIEQWDEYDRSNYYSLLSKTGTTKIAYFICTEKVLSEKAFAVSREGQLFFDTYEEAHEQLHQSPTIGDFESDTLHIHKLYLLK